MASVVITCPSCGNKLRLPKGSGIGRRSRCPKCRHSFVIEAPQTSDSFQESGAEPATMFSGGGLAAEKQSFGRGLRQREAKRRRSRIVVSLVIVVVTAVPVVVVYRRVLCAALLLEVTDPYGTSVVVAIGWVVWMF